MVTPSTSEGCCECGWDGTLYLHDGRWYCDDCEPKA
jgi:hypothetical protein